MSLLTLFYSVVISELVCQPLRRRIGRHWSQPGGVGRRQGAGRILLMCLAAIVSTTGFGVICLVLSGSV